jgi:Fe-S-cluster containining protein
LKRFLSLSMKKKNKIKLDCTRCGLCCLVPGEQDVFCNMTRVDYLKLPKNARRSVRPVTIFEAFVVKDVCDSDYLAKTKTMKTLDGATVTACIFLCGRIGDMVACKVYEYRPEGCKVACVPGDARCLNTRRDYPEWINK